MYGRNFDLHEERKCIREVIKEGKMKSLILNGSKNNCLNNKSNNESSDYSTWVSEMNDSNIKRDGIV